LEVLSKVKDIETHLVMTRAAKMTIQVETPHSVKEVEALADFVHDINNVGASISSGSFRTEGMVIAPCSMKSMGGIAHSVGGDLLVRAADVILKERKKLVLLARETPLHLGHLESMVSLTRMGAVIFPPVPAFYHRPKTLDDVINQTVTRVLDQFGIDVTLFERWSDEQLKRHPAGEASYADNPGKAPARKRPAKNRR
jgi:4-hydroxy-3-polyprenylbenzoate decarboxylase